jgi:hypothetical protein
MLRRLQLILLSMMSCISYIAFASVQSETFLARMMQKDPQRAKEILDYLARVKKMQGFFVTASIESAEGDHEEVDTKRPHEQSAKTEHCISKKIKTTK